MDNLSTSSAVPDLPSLPMSVQITILVLFGAAHLLIVLALLANFPLNVEPFFTPFRRFHFRNLNWHRKKIQDSEHSLDTLYPAEKPDQTSIPTFDSPVPGRLRPTFHSNADEDAAWSTSISPFPTTTPTPIRRYLSSSSSGHYTPSIYSPQPQQHPFNANATSTSATPAHEQFLSPSVYAPSPLEVRKKRPYVPERPHRHYDPKREFEVITPESQKGEKGSIVIGLGQGLSPLVGMSPVSVRGRSRRTVVRDQGNGFRFATPLTDVDEDEKMDVGDQARMDGMSKGEGDEPGVVVERSFVLFRALEGIVALLAGGMTRVLDSKVERHPEAGLLVSMKGLAADPFADD